MISVLIPLYNAELYIESALASLEGQSIKDFEVIICDDGSSDASLRVVEKFIDKSKMSMRVLKNSNNKGIAFTRNRLISEARRKYIAWLDADDLSVPSRFETQLKFLEENPNIFGCGGGRRLIDSSGDQIGKTFMPRAFEIDPNYIRAQIAYRNSFCNSTLMFRNLGYQVDLGYPPAEDFEFNSRMVLVEKLDMVNLRAIFCEYRVHSSNTSSNQQRQYALNRKIVERNLRVCNSYSVEAADFLSTVINPSEPLSGGVRGLVQSALFLSGRQIGLRQKAETLFLLATFVAHKFYAHLKKI